MDKLLQPVIEAFPKVFFDKQTAPSYVQMYTKSNREIVIVLIKSKQINNAEATNRNGSPVSDEFELTGSPLKLDLSLHTILDDTMVSDEPQLWSKDEISHIPISIEKAREIANLYNQTLRSTPEGDATPMWILCNPSSDGIPLLLTVQSNPDYFARGIVTYEGLDLLDDIDLEVLIENYAKQEELSEDKIDTIVDCKYIVAGVSYSSYSVGEMLNAPHSGITELRCEWNTRTLHTPFISCKVFFEQEVIIGHLLSPCNTIWKSVCALHNINQLLVDMTAAGVASVNLEMASIRHTIPNTKRANNSKRLSRLMNECETYAYTAQVPSGGCLCVTEDTATLKQCFSAMCTLGSSNDFTYKLWDILKDCENAEELINILLQALKFITTGKIRPFIDAQNNTYLSKLVVKLSRGHSQAPKVLKNLRSSPPQALSLVAQVGFEKTMWEYTKIMSLIEHSFFVTGIWNTDVRTQESIEQINQTIQDMTMSGGDFNMNPFESLSTTENSIRLECESIYCDDANDLTVDDFASLKKHGLAPERKDTNEVPIITDEIDISPWKNMLTKFSQVHVCLEHLYRAEAFLRADFVSLKPLASRLLEIYVSEKSPIKTVGQLMSDPIQKVTTDIANNLVKDHLVKPAFWYRVELCKKKSATDMGTKRDTKVVYAFTQQTVFPPLVWQNLEPSTEDVAEITTVGEELKYHCTKYTYVSNKLKNKLPI